MDKTTNLNLNKPAMRDFVSVSVEQVFGDNFDIIDAVVSAVQSAQSNHAGNTSNPHNVKFDQIIVQLNSGADFDHLSDGMFFFRNNTVNAPVTGTGLVFQVTPAGGARFQMAVHDYHGKAEIYYRSYVSGVWSVWYSSYATKESIGLGNVTNESKTTMFTSPQFTGTPTAPTAESGTDSTQLATTAFVQSIARGKLPYTVYTRGTYDFNARVEVGLYSFTSSCTLTNCPEPGAGALLQLYNSTTRAGALQLWFKEGNSYYWLRPKQSDSWGSWYKIDNTDSLLASPAFTGTPTAPTAAQGTNTTQLATTEFVARAISAITLAQLGAAASSHNHSASNITSGTLPVTRGGTGITNLTGSDYSTSRVRGISVQSTIPDSVSNGHIVGVYT